MNLKILIFVVIVGLLLIAGLVFVLRSPEDSWIKDSNGTWIKPGVPSDVPDDVKAQQDVVIGAMQLYQQKKAEGMQFNSQCLGNVGNYALDVVHVPRTNEDDLPQNQCFDYLDGNVKHFIELDKDGNIVRIM